ncbi:MAG: TauD/TfdA family dioxygenase [Ilumatobacteraceae bacterium]
MTVIDERQTSTSTSTITVTPKSPTIGAEISGVDLAAECSDDDIALIRRALLDYKVLFFRDQDITTEQHLAFGRRFGELEVHPFAPHKPDHPEVLAITHNADREGRENRWHSDVTWRLQPSLGSILRCIESPDVGGDTLFADMYAAYDGLPQRVKDRVEGRVARHDFAHFRQLLRARGVDDAGIAEMEATYPNPEHPVIRTHPETGRRGIYVNAAFTQEIVGMDPAESAELLSTLYAQATFPEYQVRFTWDANSIAFWDNRACQHYAVSDYWPKVRRVERVTIIGDTPYYDASQAPTDTAESPFRGHLKTLSES